VRDFVSLDIWYSGRPPEEVRAGASTNRPTKIGTIIVNIESRTESPDIRILHKCKRLRKKDGEEQTVAGGAVPATGIEGKYRSIAGSGRPIGCAQQSLQIHDLHYKILEFLTIAC
jgi:hypothetical protein